MKGVQSMNESEKLLSEFSQMFFFKDFVQDNLLFTPKGGTQRELADLLINLGDIIIAIQLKSRNEKDKTRDQSQEDKWLKKQCKAAKSQVKDTIEFIKGSELPVFSNNRNKMIRVNSASAIIPIVVFENDAINEYPHVLVKHSDDGMDINCMSFPDFQTMCKVLVTPIEIVSYLQYRQQVFLANPQVYLSVFVDENENWVFAKPMRNESLVHQFLVKEYDVQIMQENNDYLLDFQDFLHALPDHTVLESEEEAHFSILHFLAHFKRIEIKTFLERVHLAKKISREGETKVVGSIRKEDVKYVVFFVASKTGEVFQTDYLLELARRKTDVAKLLQVIVFWESDEEFRIDFVFWGKNPHQEEKKL